MLKIGYVTTTVYPVDGWGRYSRSLIKSVSKLANVRVITQKEDKDREFKLTAYYPVLPHYSLNPLTQLRVFFYVLKYFRGCDVVHSLVEPYAPAVSLASKIIGAKFITTMHGTFAIPSDKSLLRRYLMKLAYRNASIVTTGSAFTEKEVRSRVNLGECRIIPNGVDEDLFYRNKNAKDENYLMTVGWIKPRKGADILLRAFALIKDKYPDLKCKIIGQIGNNTFYDNLKEIINDNRMSERVDLLGRIDDKSLLDLYNNCSVFILPARNINNNFEGFPMVFYEANACGAPVITTRGFGSEYAIKNRINGILIDDADPVLLADAIEQILGNPQLHQAMRINAIKAAQKHSWDNIVKGHLMGMYEDSLKKTN